MANVAVTRTFDANIQKVWDAWTQEAWVRQWWGPNGFTCPVADMHVAEGQTSLVCMRAPAEFGGNDFYNTWSYTVVKPLERLEYILQFSDKNGVAVDPATQPLPPGIPAKVPHIVTFKADGDKTVVSVTEQGYDSEETAAISKQGLEECLDKMATALAK